MSSPSGRTIIDISDPYANYLVPVPPIGPSVCSVCRSVADKEYRYCYPCHTARTSLGADSVADATAFVSLAPTGEQFARELYTYKKPAVPVHYRRQHTIGLASVLWRWLEAHENHVARSAGAARFGIITSVPSTSGRLGDHPLKRLVSGVVTGAAERYEDLLRPRNDDPVRKPLPDRFDVTRPLAGESILVIDDTWTTGSRAQSAAAALKRAGADAVGFVAIGRWFRTDFRDNSKWLHRRRVHGWTWDRCCLE